MVYTAGNMILSAVRSVFTGKYNDVIICRDFASPFEIYYTLVLVKDKECARRLISVFENNRRDMPEGELPYIACFASGNELCYLFPYRPERRLSMFGPAQINSVNDWEKICISLVMECLSSPLPFPLLALTLEQDNIHIAGDGSVYISSYFDLGRLNPGDGEAACARRCIEKMLALPAPGRKKKLMSADLMKKKLGKNAYASLPELYRDIKITSLPGKKEKLSVKLKSFWHRNKDRLFMLLVALSAAVVIFAVIIGISQLLFGDIPIFRLFENCFGTIGTRKLS